MKHPAIGKKNLDRWVGVITPVVSIGAIRTDWEHLDVTFRPLQNGVSQAIASIRKHP